MFSHSSNSSIRRRSFWRLIWSAVLVLHAPITLRVFARAILGDEPVSDWSSLLLLSASNLFFVLEILFAPCMRLISDRRSAIAFLVIVAILHVGVLDRGFPGVLPVRDIHYWLVLSAAGAAFVAEWLRHAVRAGRFEVISAHADRLLTALRLRYGAALPVQVALRPVSSRLAAVPLRAPPA